MRSLRQIAMEYVRVMAVAVPFGLVWAIVATFVWRPPQWLMVVSALVLVVLFRRWIKGEAT